MQKTSPKIKLLQGFMWMRNGRIAHLVLSSLVIVFRLLVDLWLVASD